MQTISILSLAALLDYGIGDPKGWWHPVQGMGWVITHYASLALDRLRSPWALRGAGIVLTLGLTTGSGLVGWLLVAIAHQVHPLLGIAIASVLLASCFAARSLRAAATDVLQPLARGELVNARVRLRQYVGRDTEHLTEPDLLRAVFETVTENATDGVLAPLFYALLGAALPGIGSVPLALAYKAASTLDSMVGYRDAPYTHLGWFSARTDDALTWLPCRLVVVSVALISGRPKHVWRICRRDASQDPSPNSGWSECAYAAALNVQVGGVNWYRGVAKPKPLLGEAITPITPATIDHALHITRWCFLSWLGGFTAVMCALTFSR